MCMHTYGCDLKVPMTMVIFSTTVSILADRAAAWDVSTFVIWYKIFVFGRRVSFELILSITHLKASADWNSGSTGSPEISKVNAKNPARLKNGDLGSNKGEKLNFSGLKT